MYRFLSLASLLAVSVSGQTLQSVLEDQSDTLSVFTQFVQRAGLLDTLTSLERATIFAPTDDAFAAILDAYPDLVVSGQGNGTSSDDDDSNDDNSAQLSSRFIDILTYHVVPGVGLSATDVVSYPGVFYATALDDLVVNPYLDGDFVRIFSAEKRMSEVVSANIEFDNGVIHTIDSVLLPPEGPATTALEMGFDYFYGAAAQTDLAGDLNSTSQLTLFIPTDEAFISVGSALADLSSDQLSSLLRFHAVAGMTYFSTNVTDGDTLETLADTPYDNGLDIHVDEEDGALYVSNARVITPNILLRNGVAHLIDQVLNPQEDDGAYGYTYNLDDGEGNGVPGFEDAASATIPALTSGIPSATSSFSPTATFSQVSGADGVARAPFGIAVLISAAVMMVVV